MAQVSTIFLVKDPPLDRLAALVEYLREVSDEFIFVIDDRTRAGDIEVINAWPGVKSVLYTWNDNFAEARNQALPLVTRPWTLHVDPDELPSFKMMEHIKEVTSLPDNGVAAYLYWTPNWWGGWKGPEEPYHWHIRLWRSGRGEFYRRVHELVKIDGFEEPMTRDSIAFKAPKSACLIHSKPKERIEPDQTYYQSLDSWREIPQNMLDYYEREDAKRTE